MAAWEPLSKAEAIDVVGGSSGAPTKTPAERVFDKTFASAAKLIKLLPTTTVLVFQILSPSFTYEGNCFAANKFLTGILLGFCGILCLVVPFTDSYKGDDGKLYYGIATKNGLWTLNFEINRTVDLSSYKITFIDFVHSILSVLVFGSVAFMNNNVVSCYYPVLNDNGRQVLINVPLGVGFVCSLVFLVFPTTRHGIGYPAAAA